MSSVLLPAFASRLNSMKSKPELWEGREDLIGWIHRQGTITGLELVDFNYPEHLEGYSLAEVKIALSEAGLSTGAVCLRYPKHFSLGAFTNPAASLRREAIQLTLNAGQWARELGARELIVWPAYDGYGYPLQVNYSELWQYVVQGFREVCDFFPELRVSLEPKPTEPRRYFIQNTTGAGLLMVLEVDRENMGLTLDFGHCLMAGENPAQSVALVGKQKKLWGMQLNDGFVRPGCEDGMLLGSVHPQQTLECLLWLQRIQYDGHLYFDTFPINEDPVREAAANIRRCTRWWNQAAELEAKGLSNWQSDHDILKTFEAMEEL